MIRTVPKGRPTLVEEPKRRPGGDMQSSPAGTVWRPSSAPEGSGADWANAKAYFTMPTIDDWMARFGAEPDIWHGILADIYRETKAERERKSGQAKIGRRPRAIDGTMDELWAMVTPQYSMEPFPVAFKALVQGKLNASDFGRRTNIPRRTLDHMLTGKVPIDLYRLEQIARYFEVSPAYFREYRDSYVLTVISELLAAQPNLSIRFGRAITAAGRRALPNRDLKRAV